MNRLLFGTLLLASCTPPLRSAAVRLEEPLVCGAFAVGPRTLLTAGHCVRWQAGTAVRWEPRDIVRTLETARAVSADRERDLAWLETDATLSPVFRTRRGLEGEHVTAVSPVYDWSQSSGYLTRETYLGGEPDGGSCDGSSCRGVTYWETTLTIKPGWSGSPVLGDDGAAIGVVSSCQGFARWVGLRLEKTCKPGFALVAGL